MKETEKAWVAGVIDLKGHVYIKKNPQRAADAQQIVLSVETSVSEIIERLTELTGTNPEWKPHRNLKEEWLRRGCGEHCPDAHVHVREVSMPDVAKWSVTGAALAIVLWNLRDYITTDREPWGWIMQRCLTQLKMTGQGSSAIKQTARRLDGLGWDLPPVMRQLVPRELEAVT